MEESKEELKSLLIRGKEESEKTSLKFNIQKTKNVESHHFIQSLQDLLGPGTKPMSPALQADPLPAEQPGKPL